MPQQEPASTPARWIVTDERGHHTEVLAEQYDTTRGELEFFNRKGAGRHGGEVEVVATYAPGSWTQVHRVSQPFAVIDIPDGFDPDDIEARLIDFVTSLTTKE